MAIIENLKPIDWGAFRQSYNELNKSLSESGISSGDLAAVKAGPEFQMNQGTAKQYTQTREATPYESFLINQKQIGDFLSNLPAEIAGLSGDEEMKRNLTFDADKLFKGDIGQIGNLAISLPGQLVGAPISGLATITGEAIGGKPISEAQQKGNSWYVPDYDLDLSQRVASGISGGIDVVGTFLGPGGRAVGSVGRGIARKGIKNVFGSDVGEQIIKKGFGSEAAALEIAKAAGDKTAQRGAKWIARAQGMENMAQGWVSRAFPNVGPGGQIVSDMAEEAGEESFQQLMDDIRYKQVDEETPFRMLQAGAVGALGGGMASGGIHAINAARGNLRKPDRGASEDDVVNSALAVPKSYYNLGNDTNRGSDEFDPIVKQSVLDKYGDDPTQRTPGMFNAKVIIDPTGQYKANQMALPFRNIWLMYHNNTDDGKSLERISGLFIDRQRLNEAKNNPDEAKRAEEIAEIRKDAYDAMKEVLDIRRESGESEQDAYKRAFEETRKRIRLANSDKNTRLYVNGIRAPHTDPNSELTMEIADIVDGGAIHFSSGVYSMFNGDVDGDAWQVMLDAPADYSKLPTNRLMSMRAENDVDENGEPTGNEYGAVKFGWSEAGFGDTISEIPLDYIETVFASRIPSNVLSEAHAKYSRLPETTEEYAKRFKNACVDTTRGTAYQKLSKLFMEMSQYIDSDIAQDIMFDLRIIAAEYNNFDHMSRGFKQMREEAPAGPSQAQVNPEMEGYQRRGSLAPGTSTPIQNPTLLGWTYFLGKKSSGSFRTDQFTNWIAKEFPMYNEFFNNFDTQGNTQQWVAQILHILDISQAPATGIESLFWSTVRAHTFKKLGIIEIDANGIGVVNHKKIGNGITEEEFIDTFHDVFNEQQKFYNDALKRQGVFGDFFDSDSPLKNPLPDKGDSTYQAATFRQMERMCDNWDVTEIIETRNAPEWVKRYSFGELITMMAENDNVSAFTLFGDSFGEAGNRILDGLAKTHKQESRVRGEAVNDLAVGFSNLAKLITIDENGKAVIPDQFKQEALLYEQMIRDAVGMDTCLRYSWTNINSIFESRYGKYLIGETSNSMTILRALVAIKVGDTFGNYTLAMRENDPELANRALYQIADSDPLIQEIIYEIRLDNMTDEELRAAGKYDYVKNQRPMSGDDLLKIILDPEVMRLDELHAELSGMFKLDMTIGEFAASMLYDSSVGRDLMGTDLSKRIRDANTKRRTAARKSAFHNEQDRRNILTYVKPNGEQGAERAFQAMKYWATEAADESNSDLLVATLYNQTSLLRTAPEKAQAGVEQGVAYQNAAAANGYFAGNFLNQLGHSVGVTSSSDALKLRSIVSNAIYDENYSEDIWINGKLIHINQEIIFKAYDVKTPTGVHFEEVMQLFEKVPQLLNWTMPIKWVPGSSKDPILVPSRSADPIDRIKEYEGYDKSVLERKKQKSQIRNIISQDPDLTDAIIGFMGDDAISLSAHPMAWTRSAKKALERVVDELYYMMSLQPSARTQYYDNTVYGITDTMEYEVAAHLQRIVDQLEVRDKAAVLDMQARLEYYQDEKFTNKLEQDARANLGLSSSVSSDEAATKMREAHNEEVIRIRNEIETRLLELNEMCKCSTIGRIPTYEKLNLNDANVQRARNNIVNDLVNDQGLSQEEAESKADAELEKLMQTRSYGPSENIDKTIEETMLMPDDTANIIFKKITKFADDSANNLKNYDEIMPDLETIRDIWEDGTDNDRNTIIQEWNSQIIREHFNKTLRFYGDSRIGYYDTQYRVFNWFNDKVDEIKQATGINYTKAEYSSDHQFPRSFFSEEGMILTQRGKFALQSSGVSTMSGRDAGAYQWATALGLAPDDVSCGVAPRQTNLAELDDYFEDPNNLRINYRTLEKDDEGNITGFGRRQSMSRAMYQWLMSQGQDVAIQWTVDNQVYYPNECLTGCCCDHGYAPISSRHTGAYIPGRYFIAEFLYTLSEARVFKSKKSLGAFSTIFHTAWRKDTLKNYDSTHDVGALNWQDPAQCRNQILKARSKYLNDLSEFYNEVFEQENIDGPFGPRDALLLAQMTTPFFELRFKNGTSLVIDGTWLESDQTFDNAMKASGIDFSTMEVDYIKPVTLSLIDVMKKWNNDFIASMPEYSGTSEKYELKDTDREETWKKATHNWQDCLGDFNDVRSFLSQYQTVMDAPGGTRLATSSALSPMQKYAGQTGVRTAHNQTVEDMLNLTELSEPKKKAYETFYTTYFSNPAGKIDHTPYFIADVVGRINQDAITDNSKLKMYREIKQQNSSSSRVSGVNRAVMVDGVTPAALASIIKERITSPSSLDMTYLFVPKHIWENFVRQPAYSAYAFCAVAPTGDMSKPSIFRSNKNGGNEQYVIVDPTILYTTARNHRSACSQITPVDPLSIIISLQDFGKYCTDDSGSVWDFDSSDRQMLFTDYFTMSLDDIFGGTNQVIGDIEVVHSDEEIQEIYDLIYNPENRTKSKRIAYPKYKENYVLSDDFVKNAIDGYFNRRSKQEERDNMVDNMFVGKVGNRDVVGWLRRNCGGVVTYVPIIPNKGSKSQLGFDTLYLDEDALRRREVVFSFRSTLKLSDISTDDGIKSYFTNFAWKSFTTLNPDVTLPSLGWTDSVRGREGKGSTLMKVNQVYSGTTERGRLVNPVMMLQQNLSYLNMITLHNFFASKDNLHQIDARKMADLGITMDQARALADPNNREAWELVRNGTIKLSNDYDTARAIQIFVANILDADVNPFHVFCNMSPDSNGNYTLVNYLDFDFNLFFEDMTKNDILRVFNAINPDLCFASEAEDPTVTPGVQPPSGNLPKINSQGWILIKTDPTQYNQEQVGIALGNISSVSDASGSNYLYCPGHIQRTFFHDESTLLGIPSTKGKYGSQNYINTALESGAAGRKVDEILKYMFAKQDGRDLYSREGRMSGVSRDEEGKLQIRGLDEKTHKERYGDDPIEKILERNRHGRSSNYGYTSWKRRRDRIVEDGADTFSRHLIIKTNPEDDYDLDMVKHSRDNLRKALCDDPNDSKALTDNEIDSLFKCAALYSYNGGLGKWSEGVTARQYCTVIDEITSNIRADASKYFITGGENIANAGDRIYNPILVSGLSHRIFVQKNISTAWKNDYNAFLEAQLDQYEQTCQQIQKRDMAAKTASYDMLDFILMTNGRLDISNWMDDGITIHDMIDAATSLNTTLRSFTDDVIDAKTLKDGQARTQEMLRKARDRHKEMVQETVKSSTKPGGESRRYTFRRRMSNYSIPKAMTNVARINALLEPELWISAPLQKGVLQGQTKLGMALQARNSLFRKIGPRDMGDRTLFSKKSKENLHAFKVDDQAREVWKALKSVQWNQDDLAFLQEQSDSAESLIKLAKERSEAANKNPLEKAANKVYKLSGGGDAGIGMQLEIWAEDLFQRLQLKNDPVWMKERSDGLTEFEHQLAENPAGLLVHFMTADGGKNANLLEARQAFNVAREGEFACETATGSILSEVFRRSPFSEFLFTTNVCRFPHYSINSSKFFLKHIAPTATLTYVFNEHLAQKEKIYSKLGAEWKIAGADMTNMDFERFQKAKSLKEALLTDVYNIGVRAIGLLIIASSGVLEPPDDDRLAGNLEEWTFLGFRLKENWWIQDILGPVLAQCATFRSAELGKPRPDILVNWLGNAMYSNPLIKVADVAGTLIDPSYDYMQEYEQEAGKYDKAKGGAPSLSEKWYGDAISYGLHYGAQFLTPAIIRDLFNTLEPYEHSYKKVYTNNKTGVPGEGDQTVNTDYLDARIRQVTRKNPVLGWLMDIVRRPTTSYYQSGSPFAKYAMPYTLTPDQAQLAAMAEFSIKDSSGNEKSDEEKKAVAFKVIGVLSSTDNVDELVSQGFMLNYDTREYVSKQLHDTKKELEDQYNAWVQETGLDNYVIGDGSWTEGARLKNEIQSAFYSDLDTINGLYQKLWDDSIKYGPTYYNRYNTTYSRDVNGNIYASGFRPGFGPFLTAPGDLNNPGDTLGYSGSWETESVVVPGEGAGGRALIPADRTAVISTPNIDSWGDDKNGGYSDLRDKNGNEKTNNKNTTTKSPSSSGGSGSRGGGGGGGGRSSGGGYGTRPVRLNTSGGTISTVGPSRLMNTNRIQETQDISYLRPGFETKGSREAYKRSDI